MLRALLLAALVPLAVCFLESHPIVVWSSHSPAINRLPNSPHFTTVLETILLDDAICDYDAIVFIQQPGLHASHLRALTPYSDLTQTLRLAPFSQQFPYASFPLDANGFLSGIAEAVANKCNAHLHRLSIEHGEGGRKFRSGAKHVIAIKLTPLSKDDNAGRNFWAKHEFRLAAELEYIKSTFRKHLVVYVGSPHTQYHSKRQSPPSDILPPSGGILHRYQLLTPALIVTLLVTFFVLMPVVYFGVSALASIQSPLKVEAPKGYNAQERKNY